MRIVKHEKSHIVELADGSVWRIWPGDLAKTLHWMPSSRIVVHDIKGDLYTHVLFDRTYGTSIRAIDAAERWAAETVRAEILN